MPATPAQRKLLAAMARERGPHRPIDVYEKANNTRVPPAERGTKGNETAAQLKDMVRSGEVYSVYRDDDTNRATRYGLTALGKHTGEQENRKPGRS